MKKYFEVQECKYYYFLALFLNIFFILIKIKEYIYRFYENKLNFLVEFIIVQIIFIVYIMLINEHAKQFLEIDIEEKNQNNDKNRK